MPRRPRRAAYPSDVNDDEWTFVLSYLGSCDEDQIKRVYPLRAVFNATRYLACTGIPWPMLPNDFPPWTAVHKRLGRWIDAGCFIQMLADLNLLLRELGGESASASTLIVRNLHDQSIRKTWMQGHYDEAKWRKRVSALAATDTLRNLLLLRAGQFDAEGLTKVEGIALQLQYLAGERIEVRPFDHRNQLQINAALPGAGRHLEAVKLTGSYRGFVLLPFHWLAERRLAWSARFKRMKREYELYLEIWRQSQLPGTTSGNSHVSSSQSD